MKKRNRVRRSSTILNRDQLLGALMGSAKRPRKAWTFERLEDRQMFSATPWWESAQTYSGTLTPEQVTAGEMWWAVQQAAQLNQYTDAQLQSATKWGVWTVDPTSGAASAATFNPYFGGGSLGTINTAGMFAGDVVTQLSAADNVLAFYPIIDTPVETTVDSALDEPLFNNQWHLRNTGQEVGNPDFQDIVGVPGEDINVIGAWNLGYTGEGVVVAVVDSGFQTNHPDLIVNYNPFLSANFSGTGAGSHGTAVAGLIGASGTNGAGVTGIAYNADLVNIDIGSEIGLNDNGVFSYRNDAIDIYNMSYGPNPGVRTFVPLTTAEVFALRNAVRFGRPSDDGTPLGNIFVTSAGNNGGGDFTGQGFSSSGYWDGSNYSGFKNSRYVITVGGVDHDGVYFNTDGTLTNYPEAGANVLIVAPTGSVSLDVGLDSGTGSGIVTTDLTGNEGYNMQGTIDGDFIDDPNYTSRFNGTSASTPIVSGVIALMLEANPNLSYRDVQEILVRSARQNSWMTDVIQDSEGWQTNIYETWESPATDFMTGLPMEDPYARDDVDPTWDADDIIRTIGSPAGTLLGLTPIDNYSVYQMPKWENGAGYTVHTARGIFAEEYGYGHGVIDAELAVKLAEQWSIKGQTLAPELTYTTFVRPGNIRIPAAAKVGPDGDPDAYIIPGLLGGAPAQEFHAYYDEFFADDPFSGDDPPVDDNGSSLPISFLDGFTPPLMQIEWVEVKINIQGLSMNETRIALRSPDGTISDLNLMIEQNDDTSWNMNDLDQDELRPGTSAPGSGLYTFSTNRHWGERIDDFFEIDPDTGTFAVDPDTQAPIMRSWELIIENYETSVGTLNGFEIVFHGTPIGEGTERISGKVGLDTGTDSDQTLAGDGEFNFDRSLAVDVDMDGTIDTRTPDPNQEAFGANFTVRVFEASNLNEPIDEFVTGADGNFYFDLAPGDYVVKVVDRDGFTAIDDQGLDPRYQKEWAITIDPLDAFTRTAGRSHVIDDDRDGIQDSAALRYEYYNDVNFLMDGSTQPAPEVTVNGFVFADVNGDGTYNNSDTEGVGFHVYADLNNSGSFEQNEPDAFTDSDGIYTFVVPEIASLQNIVIICEPLTSEWLATNPVGGRNTLLQGPGGIANDVNFGFRPPLNSDPNNPPGDPGDPGTIMGLVYNDRNGNGKQDTSDAGVAGVRIYVDIDADGIFDYTDANANGKYDDGEVSEPTDVTNEFGGYFLADINPGLVRIDIVVPQDWVLTSPLAGFIQSTLVDGGQLNGQVFGIRNLAVNDFGDLLGAGYATTGANAAQHQIVQGFHLGSKIDGEINGQPNADATGDDAVTGDEDGVVLLGAVGNQTGMLVAGATNVVQVTVAGVGGYLNAWFDFNKDGDFNDDGEHALVDVDLNPGVHSGVDLQFVTPVGMAAGSIPARFRWGTAGLNYFGSAIIGEVEDYMLANTNSQPVSAAVPGDYDLSGLVDQADFNVWLSTFGSTTNLAADGNNDGRVDLADYSIWRDHLGQEAAVAAGSGGAAIVAGPAGPVLPNVISRHAEIAAAKELFAAGGWQTVSAELLAYMQSIGATPVTNSLGWTSFTLGNSVGSAATGGGAGIAAEEAADSDAAPLSLVGLQFSTTVDSTTSESALESDSTVAGAATDLELLLIDSAFAGEDEALGGAYVARQEDEDLDLALAAAFEENDSWWTAI